MKYIEKLAKDYGIEENAKIRVPVTPGTTLFSFCLLVGSIMFLALRSRPDILFSVIYLSQFNTAHNGSHIKALLQVLQYVMNTRDYSINLSSCVGEKIDVFTDASWATDLETCRSFGGHLIYVGGVAVGWGCSKQKSVAASIMEAEFVTTVDTLLSFYWLSYIFEKISLLNCVNRLVFHSDSLASIQFTRNDVEKTRSKHIRVKYAIIREYYEEGLFSLSKIPTEWNVADIFTKWLDGTRLEDLCANIF
uniref:RNase H type-1 domain-containing protein n=1 Tax=Strigamia maritima TaxID=126957 RepID=T1ILY0_STRMM